MAKLDEFRLLHQKSIQDFFLNVVGKDRDRRDDATFRRTALGRALLDHRLQAAIHFARLRDEDGLSAQLRNSWGHCNLVRPIFQDSVGLCQANHASAAPRLGDGPAYLLGTPSVTSPADPHIQLTDAALETVSAAGFRSLLDSAGLVILVHRRELFGISNSWTTTALPSTIYSDFVVDPVAFGAELAHEAAHLWLNDALAATGNIRRGGANFASPWKGEPRKAFGFLHAVFAFSIVTSYLKWAIDAAELSNECRRYLGALKARETQRLIDVRGDVVRVLKLINCDLADLVADVHRQAVGNVAVAV